MSTTISPLAPASFPDMPPVAGVRLATAAAGIRYPGRTDVLLALFDPGTAVSGVFTRSKCPSARGRLVPRADRKRPRQRAGGQFRQCQRFHRQVRPGGDQAHRRDRRQGAGCKPADVFLASTGVIGEPLDATKFAGVMDRLAADATPGDWHTAAKAIMTTDTFPKGAAADGRHESNRRDHLRHRQRRRHDRARHGNHAVVRFHRRADRAARCSGRCCATASTDTFNAVTIDGDTSTSDTLLAFATGAAAARGVEKIARLSDPRLAAFRKGFNAVLANLAEQVARDGEGARKLVEIVVEGAVSKKSARRIALSIANSPLVKTAIAGEDANWGRVVMAVGKAGEPADRDRLAIWFGGIRVAHKGARDPAYDEAAVSAAMKQPEITLKVALGLGKGRDRVLTCDLTKEYVAINGDYRS